MTWFRKPDGPDPTLAMAPVGPFADMAPPPPPPVTETRRRKWMRRLSRGFAIFCVFFLLLVGWLALTAPLSTSIAPLAPPQITSLTSAGPHTGRAPRRARE